MKKADPRKKFIYQGHHQLTTEILCHVSIWSSYRGLSDGDLGFDFNLEGYFWVEWIFSIGNPMFVTPESNKAKNFTFNYDLRHD